MAETQEVKAEALKEDKEKQERSTLKGALKNVLEAVEKNAFPYDPAKDRKRLEAMEIPEEDIVSIIEGKIRRIEEKRESYDRMALAMEAFCAIEFWVLEQHEKLEQAAQKVKAAK